MYAVVVQMDRTTGFYPVGSRFESWRRCQNKCITFALHGAGKRDIYTYMLRKVGYIYLYVASKCR